MPRLCVVCGRTFKPKPKAVRQVKCTKDCGRTSNERNRSRASNRREHDLTFIGVDGEGVTDADGTHRYVLLSVGDQSISDPKGLTFTRIMAFLYGRYKENPTAVFVGFFLGYDFTQWFRTLPEERAYYLLHKQGIAARQPKSAKRNMPFPVGWGEWEFDILNNRRFKLRRKGDSWMYVNDVGGFFQKSFLAVIDPSAWPEPIIDAATYDTIKTGKERRTTAVLDDDMIAYNVAENRALAVLMSHYNRGLVAADIRLQRDQWFGPGQAAQAWLDNIGAPTSKDYNECIPGDVHLASLASYYGGWFEILLHGRVPGTTYEYDINSAYPTVIADLPCLLHGKWTSGRNNEYPRGLTLVYCHVVGSHPLLGPLPHRDNEGLISHPLETKGWYFAEEIADAMNAGLIDKVTTERWYHYTPCDCAPPMRTIRNLYERRIQVGKKSPEGQALKLVYNSVYGKNAQSAGHPKYACALYASLITSGCRRRILQAIATHPNRVDDVCMIATDGIYFRSPHPSLPLDSEALGLWSEEKKTELCLFLPGVYWDDKTRKKIAEGKAPSLKSRGVSSKALATMIDTIDAQFESGNDWPSVTVTLGFALTSATQAMARGKWETAGQVGTMHRTMSADPSTKRNPIAVMDGDVLRTYPYQIVHKLESLPYSRTMGIKDLAESIDGPLDSLFSWALGR